MRRPLRNKAVFAQASKGEGGHSVVWPGDIDIGAERIWEMTLGQNGRMDAVDARARMRPREWN